MKSLNSRLSTPWWIAALSVLVIAGCGSDDDPVSPTAAAVSQVNSVNSSVPQNVFSATLAGSEEVPPVNTAATGTGLVVIDPTTRAMKATIVTADIAGTQAHIHAAPRGVAGPVVFPLVETGGAGSGVWTTTVTLSSEQLTQLQSGNYYFNVHSTAFPEGEIRGQITASLPQSSGTITTTSTTTTSTG
ncbi:MAG: CHRD domain-containing protein, partial [Burkholderiaceae bacterium]|nr:CHRD domain-containing protein [Burkholderiaceae bacterium]